VTDAWDSENYAVQARQPASATPWVRTSTTSTSPPEPEPARHITTLAGNRVPVIDPYGAVSWDAP
jgi:hypothetical protein